MNVRRKIERLRSSDPILKCKVLFPTLVSFQLGSGSEGKIGWPSYHLYGFEDRTAMWIQG